MHDPITSTTLVAERDATKIISFSPSFLRQKRRVNGGPAFIRLGRAVRYRIADLQRWLDAHRIETHDS